MDNIVGMTFIAELPHSETGWRLLPFGEDILACAANHAPLVIARDGTVTALDIGP